MTESALDVPATRDLLDQLEREQRFIGLLTHAELLRTLSARLDALVAAEQDREKLLRFAGMAFKEVRGEWLGTDWGGDAVQDAMVRCGLLDEHAVTKPCSNDDDGCSCAEFGFPTTCYRPTALGDAARSSVSPARVAPGPQEK